MIRMLICARDMGDAWGTDAVLADLHGATDHSDMKPFVLQWLQYRMLTKSTRHPVGMSLLKAEAEHSSSSKQRGESRAQELSFFFCNVTSWSKAAQCFVLEQDVHCLLVVEHHQVGEKFSLLKQQCAELGWKGCFSPALETAAGGTSAGVFAVAKRHINPVDDLNGTDPRWNGFFIRRRGFDLLVLVAYFKDGGAVSTDQLRSH